MPKPRFAAGWLRHVRLLIGLKLAMLLALWSGASFAQTLVEIRPITAGNASGALSSPQYMVDGDPNTLWNSGGPPTQWIDIDLQRDRQVMQIHLLTAQAPNGPTNHNVYGRTQAGQWVGLGILSGYTSDNQWLTLEVPPSIPIRYVIVQTTGGPSWVAWREIKVFEGLQPHQRGDVVGRDLAFTGLGSIGHLGLWDGQQVFEVLNEPTVVQANTYDNFAARSKTWDPIYTKIPSFSVRTCFIKFCFWRTNSSDRVLLESRRAIAARAEQIRAIGATYTLIPAKVQYALPEMSDPADRTAFKPAVQGVYRSDAYILDIFGFTNVPNGPYWMWYMGTNFPVERVVTGDPPSWATNIKNLHQGVILPLAIYQKIKAFTP
ncbi:MAG TPA: discoidin domain-containing protein [Burkholderiaceae bacterium]|nr:discoidin domain-containing protein [Burkholderiaceae bacterium]